MEYNEEYHEDHEILVDRMASVINQFRKMKHKYPDIKCCVELLLNDNFKATCEEMYSARCSKATE